MNTRKRKATFSQKLGAIGIAFGYLALFVGLQVIVELIVGIVWGLYYSFSVLPYGDFSAETLAESMPLSDLTLISLIISNVLALFFGIILMELRKKPFENEVGWHKLNKESGLLAHIAAPVSIGFALSILVTMGFAILFSLFPSLNEVFETYTEKTSVFEEGNSILTFLATVIAAPVAEELIFRGFIYTRLRRAFSYVPSLLITALLFGLVHGTLVHMLYVPLLSIILCIFYDRYRTLWAPILLHFGFNLAGSTMMYYTDIPFWFVGICAALMAFGIIMLCAYRPHVTDETWSITMSLPQKKTAPQYDYAASCIYPPTNEEMPIPEAQNEAPMESTEGDGV